MSATHADGRPKKRLPELDLGAPSADRSVIPGLAELQAPAPTRAEGSTLDDDREPSLRGQNLHLQAEVDETHDRVTELDLELARKNSLLIEAADALRVSSVKRQDQIDSALSLACYMSAWGIT